MFTESMMAELTVDLGTFQDEMQIPIFINSDGRITIKSKAALEKWSVQHFGVNQEPIYIQRNFIDWWGDEIFFRREMVGAEGEEEGAWALVSERGAEDIIYIPLLLDVKRIETVNY